MTDGVDDRGVPLPARPWRYEDRLIEAIQVAAQIHAAQVRKDTTIPYLSHLLGACSFALDHGATEDEAIAALLHDAIEDGRPIGAAKATVSSFGDEVRRIVDGCTDADEDSKPPWFDASRRTSPGSRRRIGPSCSCRPRTSFTTRARSSVTCASTATGSGAASPRRASAPSGTTAPS